MYEVAIRCPRPLELSVIQFETKVGWEPCRLDRGDVCPSNFRRWELVCKVTTKRSVTLHVFAEEGISHCPETCSSTDVDYFLDDC